MMLANLLIALTLSTVVYTSSALYSIQQSNKSMLPSTRLIRRMLSSSSGTSREIPKTVEGWKIILSPDQFAVLRQKATEPSGYSEKKPGELEYELKKNYGTKYPKTGMYACVGCGTQLYKADTKFDSGCGWPAFFQGMPNAIKEIADADGRRVEILCNCCGSHLGHVFKNEVSIDYTITTFTA